MEPAPPPSSSGAIPPLPASSSNQFIFWDDSFANPTIPRTNPSFPRLDDKKETNGAWSTGASTNVSIAGMVEDTTLRSSLFRHFHDKIDTTHTDLILIICGFVSGLVDGLSFNAWGSFASMQTGNTVFIALGVSGQPAYPAYLWAKSLIALTVFLTSNVLFIHASRFLGARRRSTLILSFGVQSAALLAAAILVQLGIIDPKPEDPRAPIEWMQILPISLLSFQAGGQIVTSRVLGLDEIPTVVLTTLLCDLLVDPKLTEKVNHKRNRRIGAFLALFLGAMTAGGLSKLTEMSASLWFAFGLKFGIMAGWFVWKGERGRKGDVEG
ncbi:hypothetical protein BBP40_004420 [Aspergillus hancockii]|nr:hypothetical protein BBP40_004420 [Aspergillus hancockii]